MVAGSRLEFFDPFGEFVIFGHDVISIFDTVVIFLHKSITLRD